MQSNRMSKIKEEDDMWAKYKEISVSHLMRRIKKQVRVLSNKEKKEHTYDKEIGL